MSKRVAAKVKRLVPDLDYVDGHYFFTPVDHLLAGFVYESVSVGVRVSKFLFPLYDKFSFLHLLYGEDLPPDQSYIDKPLGSVGETAQSFVELISPFMGEMRDLKALQNFQGYLEHHPLRDYYKIRYGEALTQIMLGQDDIALAILEALIASESATADPHFPSDRVRLLVDAILLRQGSAKSILLDWETEAKQALGIA